MFIRVKQKFEKKLDMLKIIVNLKNTFFEEKKNTRSYERILSKSIERQQKLTYHNVLFVEFN